MEDEWLPTGHGIRTLTPSELADLWDVPLLLQELVLKVEGGAEGIKDPLRSPPAKVLSLGGDSLLAHFFWGSAAAEVLAITESGRPKQPRTQGTDHAENKAPKLALDLDEATFGTEACTIEGHEGPGLDDPGIGWWLTEEDDVREHMPSAVPRPTDVTFILEQEDPSLIPEFLTAACQQGEDTPAPYHLFVISLG